MAKHAPDTGAALQRIDFDGVQLDVSPETGGIWFDVGEIGSLAERKDKALIELDQEYPGAPSATAGATTSMKCPNDGTALQEQLFGHIDGLVIHQCPTCFGCWVDHVALEKIGEWMVGQQSAPRPPVTLTPEAKHLVDQFTTEHEAYMAKAQASYDFWRHAQQELGPINTMWHKAFASIEPGDDRPHIFDDTKPPPIGG